MTDKPTAAPEMPSASPTNTQGTRRGIASVARSLAAQAWSLLAMPLLAIVLALIVGAIVIILSSSLAPGASFDVTLPFRAYQALLQGSLGSPDGRVTTLVEAAPLILAGLGVGLGFKAGLFNIGAQGQFLVGAVFAVAAALLVRDSDPLVAIPFAVIVGFIAGALWGFIPGILKATSGAHEVVTTIMLNFVALALVSWLIVGPLHQVGSPQPVTPDVGNAALPIFIGRDGHIGIILAFLAVPVMWFLLYRTTLGFEIRAAGANQDAARYAGMKTRRLIVLTMSLSGALIGLAGGVTLLGVVHQTPFGYDTAIGFDAITVALLARSNPIAVLFSGLLLGAMRAGGPVMQTKAGVPSDLVDALEAIILLFIVINFLRRYLARRRAGGIPPEFETVPAGPYSVEAAQ